MNGVLRYDTCDLMKCDFDVVCCDFFFPLDEMMK